MKIYMIKIAEKGKYKYRGERMYEYRRKPSRLKKVIGYFLLIISVATISIFIYDIYINTNTYSNNQAEMSEGTRLSNTEETNKTDENNISEMLESTIKCIVGISKIRNTGNSIFLENSTEELGLGTGMIISENGYILTNWHVAGEKYSSCYVTLENGNTVRGNVSWADKDLDLAIVKIDMNNLECIKLGNSDDIKIGDITYAIGNPIGVEFQRTVTSGIISGIDRTIKITDENGDSYMEDLIQTDATINPGNSGGPLINLNGEVIGINSVKIEEAEGIGFAVPINIVKPIIENFKMYGKFDEAYIGIFAYDKNVIPYLDSNLKFDSGIYVAQISKDGPAYNSELNVGDIITKIDDITINKMSQLREYIYTKKIGDEVKLTVLRNKREYNIKIKLGKKV